MTTNDIVGKLWNLCNSLKDDGVTYHQYVTELTWKAAPHPIDWSFTKSC